MWEQFFQAAKKNLFCCPVYCVNCEKSRSDQGLRDKIVLVSNEVHSVEYGSLKYFLYCAIAGASACSAAHTIVTPLDVVKCRMQADPSKYSGIIKGIEVTMADEGLKGFIRGWAPTMIGYGLQGAWKFGLYEAFKLYYSNLLGEEISYKWRTSLYLAASASAEIIADIFLCPFETLKVKTQTHLDFPVSLRQGARYLYQHDGIMHGFYKELIPLWCRQVPFTMAMFTSFERTLEALYKYVVPKPRSECTKGEQLLVTLAAGYIAGILSAIVSHPADTVMSKLDEFEGSSVTDAAKKLGFAGLWKGLAPRIVMVGSLTAAQLFVYDAIKVWLRIPRPPPPEIPESLKAQVAAKGEQT